MSSSNTGALFKYEAHVLGHLPATTKEIPLDFMWPKAYFDGSNFVLSKFSLQHLEALWASRVRVCPKGKIVR